MLAGAVNELRHELTVLKYLCRAIRPTADTHQAAARPSGQLGQPRRACLGAFGFCPGVSVIRFLQEGINHDYGRSVILFSYDRELVRRLLQEGMNHD